MEEITLPSQVQSIADGILALGRMRAHLAGLKANGADTAAIEGAIQMQLRTNDHAWWGWLKSKGQLGRQYQNPDLGQRRLKDGEVLVGLKGAWFVILLMYAERIAEAGMEVRSK